MVSAVVAVLVTAGLAGCSSPPGHHEKAAPAPATHLVAKLISPTNVTLEWKGAEPGAVGRVVEFATEPDGAYSILQFVPNRQTSFTHRDLMPETSFYYRVRPYYGPASTAVPVTLPDGPFDDKAQAADREWARPQTIARGPVGQQSIRNSNAAAAAPADLRATIMDANSIRFTWIDHASDEEGYLLEVKAAGSDDFTPVEVMNPNVNSVGLITLPDEKKASYRLRAFYYGKPSNQAHQTTGTGTGVP
jgi:hypothetical protein